MSAARGLRMFAAGLAAAALGSAGVALSTLPIAHWPLIREGAAMSSVSADNSQPTSYTALADGSYEVVHVIDGDTLDVLSGTTTVRLRLIGMDTPEVVDPRKPVECFGKEASAKGKSLMPQGTLVRLTGDSVTGPFDIYGRTLAYVYLPDGTFYNLFMIANGFAHEYDYGGQKYRFRSQFEAAQADAKAQSLGFWSPSTCDGNTTQPALGTLY